MSEPPPRRALGLLLGLLLLGCDGAKASPPVAPFGSSAPRPPSFLKGQLHAHTDHSGDSDTPASEAAAWYAEHGFDFVVFTDHNRVTETPAPPGLLALRGVELTQNLRSCAPPPELGDACLLHVNALFVDPTPGPLQWEPLPGLARAELYGRAVDRARALGGIAQLNHPNFQHGADLEVLLGLARRGLALVEIANQAVDSGNEGDPGHLSTEALWDAALTRGARVYGTATDDAHHYGDAERVRARGETAYTGDRGFVMVRAEKNLASIRAAVAAGDFYASTGVILDRLTITKDAVDLAVRPEAEPLTLEVIVSGQVVEQVQASALQVDRKRAGAGYLRLKITDARGRRAWTQPVWP